MDCVALTASHQTALREFLADFAAAGEGRISAFLPDPDWQLDEMARGFEHQSRGEGLPVGWVPCTTRFLVHEARILGVFNLRHELTEFLSSYGGHVGYSVRPSERRKGYGTMLLEQAMDLARELGMARLLVTCEPGNLASIGVIEACGGVFEDQITVESMGHDIQRYWISLS